jgi:hypothetical protein
MAPAEGETRLDEYITLAQAAAELPPRRGGRPTTLQCLYRWTNQGCRGVRLRFVQVGATRCTNRRFLAEFFEALTRDSIGTAESGPPIRTPAARRKAIEKAKRDFEAIKP